jgi:hypothetical protein
MSARRVVLVLPTGALVDKVTAALPAGDTVVAIVSDFRTARALLFADVDLVVSELKLGAYNGLHLAMSAGQQGIRGLVLGPDDPVLMAEATGLAVPYLSAPFTHDRLVAALAMPVARREQRQFTRKTVSRIDAYVDTTPVALVDLSYGGVRFEASPDGTIPATFVLRLPHAETSWQAQRIWSLPASESAAAVHGAAVVSPDPVATLAWRAVVDSASTTPTEVAS